MLITIDFENEIPIYSQLRNQIVEGIANGMLKDGETLPSVRQMAEDIGINLHTVNKAYIQLKEEGFIKLDRRRGAFVNLNFDQPKDNIKQSLKKELTVTMAEAHCKKISKTEITELIDEIFKGFLKAKEGAL